MKAAIMIILGLAMIGFIDISDANNEIELLMDSVVIDTTDLNTYYHNRMSDRNIEMFKVKMNTIVQIKVSTSRAINEINTFVKYAKDRGKNRDTCGVEGLIELMQTVKAIVSKLIEYRNIALYQRPFEDAFKSGIDLIFDVASGFISSVTDAKNRFNEFSSEVTTAKTDIEKIRGNAIEGMVNFAKKMEKNLRKSISSIKRKVNACTNKD